MAMEAGVEVAIISHSLVTQMVATRANALGMKHVYIGQRPKLDVLSEWMDELGLEFSQIAFMGDDLNDLEIMQHVGFSACPANAVKKIHEVADVILARKGGDGAVREFIDRFILG